MKNISKRHLAVLTLLWLLIHLLLFKHYGIRYLFDSVGYLNDADYLIEQFDITDAGRAFYSLPIFFIAISRWLFSGEIVPFLVFQCVLSGISMLALYLASSTIFKNQWAGFFSCLLFLLWWDNIHWNTAIMTESLACSVICFTIYVLSQFKNTPRHYVWLTVLLSISLLTRPTGVIIVLAAIIFLFSNNWHTLHQKPALLISLIAGFVAIGFFSAYFLFEQWDFTEQYAKGNIVTYMDVVKGDSRYTESLRIVPTNITLNDSDAASLKKMITFMVDNPLYFLRLACWKIWFLMTSIRPYYSTVHNVYSLSWVAFIYFLFLLGWRNTIEKPIKLFVITVIIVNCGLIGISSVDWDNRFYIPMEPGLVLLAGGGAASLFSFIKARWKAKGL